MSSHLLNKIFKQVEGPFWLNARWIWCYAKLFIVKRMTLLLHLNCFCNYLNLTKNLIVFFNFYEFPFLREVIVTLNIGFGMDLDCFLWIYYMQCNNKGECIICILNFINVTSIICCDVNGHYKSCSFFFDNNIKSTFMEILYFLCRGICLIMLFDFSSWYV